MSGSHVDPVTFDRLFAEMGGGPLGVDEFDALHRHLAGCAACQKEFARQRQLHLRGDDALTAGQSATILSVVLERGRRIEAALAGAAPPVEAVAGPPRRSGTRARVLWGGLGVLAAVCAALLLIPAKSNPWGVKGGEAGAASNLLCFDARTESATPLVGARPVPARQDGERDGARAPGVQRDQRCRLRRRGVQADRHPALRGANGQPGRSRDGGGAPLDGVHDMVGRAAPAGGRGRGGRGHSRARGSSECGAIVASGAADPPAGRHGGRRCPAVLAVPRWRSWPPRRSGRRLPAGPPPRSPPWSSATRRPPVARPPVPAAPVRLAVILGSNLGAGSDRRSCATPTTTRSRPTTWPPSSGTRPSS